MMKMMILNKKYESKDNHISLHVYNNHNPAYPIPYFFLSSYDNVFYAYRALSDMITPLFSTNFFAIQCPGYRHPND